MWIMGTKTSWQRIEAIVEHYHFRSVNAFSNYIGLNRSENLYQIKKGNGISVKLAQTIIGHFPDINFEWLMIGNGPMLRNNDRDTRVIWTVANSMDVKVTPGK